jgi:hypothetical protein
MTVEAYLSVKIPSWRKSIFNSKKAALVSILIVLTFCLLDLNMILNQEFNYNVSNSNKSCHEKNKKAYEDWFMVGLNYN